jgi:hypothetical protein
MFRETDVKPVLDLCEIKKRRRRFTSSKLKALTHKPGNWL